jgi:hypothetical protein
VAIAILLLAVSFVGEAAAQAPTITSVNSTAFQVGMAGNFTVTTSGTPLPALSESGVLPGGTSFVDHGDGTGTLSGTPMAGSGGTYTVTFTASNGTSPNAAQPFTLMVQEAPSFTSASSASFRVGTAGSFTVTTSGFPAVATLNKTGALPSGVTFTDNGNGTATLSGTPGAGTAGGYPLALTADNGVSPAATQSFTLNVQTNATSTSLTSTPNPSAFGQTVTFTATVTGNTPTGIVTFKDGATTLGASTLNGAGQAIFATSSLGAGAHAITAAYGGDGANLASASSALSQTVSVPADSAKLQAMQAAGTQLVSQGSGQAIAGAIGNAIAEGFNEGGALITSTDTGVRINFAGEPPTQHRTVAETAGEALAALGYADRGRDSVYKAPVAPPPRPRVWLAWAEVRGTGWSTNAQAGDIRGGQINALAGVTRKLTPDFLAGAFGGYENFDYTSQLLNGRLKGDGWTVGGYLGWRLMRGLRFDAGVARSGVSYDGQAGTAFGTFTGQRWLASAGLTGMYKTRGFEIEPSAKVYALWEREGGYLDSLGIAHADNNFSNGRVSTGAKVAYPWLWSPGATVAPYGGIYADYYFNQTSMVPLAAPNLLPTEFVHGLSARVTSGLEVATRRGPRLSVGGEVGGLGNDFTVWSVRGRAFVPF